MYPGELSVPCKSLCMNYLLDLALHVSGVCSFSICILKSVTGNSYFL